MQYPGGKNGAGVIQRIINLMPYHDIYIEPFVGSGAVFRAKQPASKTVIIDADAGAIANLEPFIGDTVNAIHGDAISWLYEYDWRGTEFVFCDPPYRHCTRTKKKIYEHEMTDQQHVELLAVFLQLSAAKIPAKVMIAGYRSAMYDEALSDWMRIDYEVMTRGGKRIESLWLNYEPPAIPAELTYLGENFRERERIKRKKARWKKKLEGLPIAERHAIMEVLTESFRETTKKGE